MIRNVDPRKTIVPLGSENFYLSKYVAQYTYIVDTLHPIGLAPPPPAANLHPSFKKRRKGYYNQNIYLAVFQFIQ